jgi:hypothetical protein
MSCSNDYKLIFRDVITEERMTAIAVRMAMLMVREDEQGFYNFFDSLSDVERGYVKAMVDNLTRKTEE